MSNIVEILKPAFDIRTDELPIDALSREYLKAKAHRREIDAHIHEIETALVELVGHRGEGSFSYASDHFKVTTTGKLYRKVAEDQLTALRKVISRTLFNKVFRTKHEVNKKELDYLSNNEPEIYSEIAKVVTTTPGKTALKVEALD